MKAIPSSYIIILYQLSLYTCSDTHTHTDMMRRLKRLLSGHSTIPTTR